MTKKKKKKKKADNEWIILVVAIILILFGVATMIASGVDYSSIDVPVPEVTESLPDGE